MDWKNQTQHKSVHVYMVSPQNLDVIIDELQGVDFSASRISAAYYTDTRTSGKIRVVGDNYIRNTFLRVVVDFPDFEQELGTYAVTNDPLTIKSNAHVYDLSLQSMLWAYAQNECAYILTVKAGASSLTVASDECDLAHDLSAGRDCKVTSTIVYQSGVNRLRRMMDLLDMGGNRVDVNGHGVIIAQPPTRSRAPKFTLSLNDPHGITHGEIRRESDFMSRPNLYGVAYRYSSGGGQQEIGGHAFAQGDISYESRGYIVTDLQVVSELSPATWAYASQLAAQRLAEARESVTWRLDSRFFPIWEGDYIQLDVGDADPLYSGVRTCLVSAVDIDLQHLDMSLTLKEV